MAETAVATNRNSRSILLFKRRRRLLKLELNKYDLLQYLLLIKRSMVLLQALHIILLAIVSTQASQDPTSIELRETVETVILPGQQQIYTFSVSQDLAADEDLYINAEPVVPDPLQLPSLFLTAQDYRQNCFNSRAQFSSFCRLPSQQIKKGRQFAFRVSCMGQCHLLIRLYTSKLLTLELGKELSITALAQSSSANIVSIFIPEKEEYQSLRVTALIDNLQESISQAKEGVTMKINWGDDHVISPTESQFMADSQELFSGGRVAFLSREKVSPGLWLKVYLSIAKGISVKFSVTKRSQGRTSLQFGTAFLDMIGRNSSQRYEIDTFGIKGETQSRVMELVFNFFSGNSTIAIGFDGQFNRKIEVSRKHPSVSVEITPSMRKEYQFDRSLFVRMESVEGAQFQLYTQLVNEEVALMKPYTAYYDELKKGQAYNYILDERYTIDILHPTEEPRSYTFKVEISKGSGKFYLARCQSAELLSSANSSIQNCTITQPSQLTAAAFSSRQIQGKTAITGSLTTLHLEYNGSECALIERRESREHRRCLYQVVAVGLSEEPWVYSIYAQRKYHIKYLREKQISKEFLAKDSYSFFAFALPDYRDVSEVTFFTTTFSGKSSLLASLTDKFPNIQSKASDLRSDSGPKSSITFKGSQLTGDVYLSVYAETFTEINIGVAVHRSSKGGIKEVSLKEGNILSYTLAKGQGEVHFKSLVRYATNVMVNVNEVVGLVELRVLREDGSAVTCWEGASTRSSCSFKVEANDTLLTIVVTGSKDKEQQFTISCIHQSKCKTGILNAPFFVTLSGLGGECYTFTMSRPISLTYTSSLTPAQLAHTDIETQLFFNQGEYDVISSSLSDIDLKTLTTRCPVSQKASGTFSESCLVGLNFISTSDTAKSFYFSLDESDQEQILFDGVAKRLPDLEVPNDQRYLYYKVSDDSRPIKVFTTTSTLVTDFYVAAKLVPKDSFVNRKGSPEVYPFMAGIQATAQADNLYHTLLGSVGTSVFTIPASAITNIKADQDYCYLLISVFTAPNKQQRDAIAQTNIVTSEITIEIVQTETILNLGSTINGFVTVGNYETYIVSPENALVSLRTVGRSGSRAEACATIQGAYANGSVAVRENIVGSSTLQLNQTDGVEYIFVRARLPDCSYQISYTSLTRPIYNVKLSQPYEIWLEAGQTKHYIYYHSNTVGFKIVKEVGAGKLTASILPVKQKEKLRDALEKQPSEYPLVYESDSVHTITNNDEHFCFYCYYLVVLTTDSIFQGEIIFLRLNDPIPLTTNYALKTSVGFGSSSNEQVFYYYSLTDFNLTFQVIAGEIAVQIQEPSGAAVYQEAVNHWRTFRLIAKAEGQVADYFSIQSRYRILVSGVAEAHYYIRVDKNVLTERIFEGLPASFQMSYSHPISVEFSSGQNISSPLTLMVNAKGNFGRLFPLEFAITGEDENGQPVENQSLLIQLVKDPQIYLLTLQNFGGSYFITITCTGYNNITLLLLNEQLTHLSPAQTYFFNREGVYQIFSNQSRALVEVLDCQGNFYLLASKDIKDTRDLARNSSSPIALRRPNYGGHYVFGVEGIYGSYFLRVKGKGLLSEVEYKIAYSYYNQINPYDFVDAVDYDISYEWSSERLKLSVNKPQVTQGGLANIVLKNVAYSVIVSNETVGLKRYSRCGIKADVLERVFINISEFEIDSQLIKKLLENTNVSETFFVVVRATVSAIIVQPQKQPYPQEITFFYNTVEISERHYRYIFTDSGLIFLGWVLLPLLIGALVVYYGLKYCIRRLLARQGHMVEEVEIVAASNPTIPSSSKMIQEGIVHPDSAAAQIKEQI